MTREEAIKILKEERWYMSRYSEEYKEAYDMAIEALSADAVQGEWIEKEVMVDEDTNITEWQSARCSVCGKYHTTPYMYYFDDFNFCPSCGARMKGGDSE